jgi:Uma2 family endonuclease
MIATSIAPANDAESRVSPDEYRALERQREQRHEYDNGLQIPMIGGSSSHNQISLNLIRLLDLDRPYQVFALDMRLWLPAHNHGTYPDLMVIDGDPVFSPDRTDEVLNPTLIVEVLSPSTAEYDRTKKFEKYCSIPEFREYLLVSQTEAAIDRFWLGEDGDWRWRRTTGLDQELAIATEGLTLPLAKIYRSVKWD